MRIIHLTKEADPIVDTRVKSGRYASASEVMCSALSVLEREESEHEAKMAVLQSEIEEGLASGDADAGVVGRLMNYADEVAAEIEAMEDECQPIA